MNLDPRIIEGKRPLTCFDIEEARKYVGKLCYVSNSYDCFRDLKNLVQEVILTDVEDCEIPFHFYIDNQKEFCLPAEWVKPEEPEKKYRPFTPDEFADTFTIGEPIIFRRKQSKRLYEYNVLFIGCCFLGDNTDVVLGNDRFSLETLFNNYEWRQHGSYEWKPFGIEVKENEEE